jgi:hypothetical protein
MEGRNPAIRESHNLARVRDTLREPGITKRIVQRRPEIDVPRSIIRIIWARSVISVDPGFCRSAAHIAHDFLVGRTPRQPDGRS